MSDNAQNKRKARQLLHIDDDSVFTQVFRDSLIAAKPGDWIVHVAEGYATALACLGEHKVDVVILDLTLPIMDGLQFLPLLKRQHPELPVIVLTGAATPENRAHCMENGASLFFDKADLISGVDGIHAALEAVATAPAEGFRGMLRQVGLGDVLQLECLGRKSSVLEVGGSGISGRIYIQDGNIIHAEEGEMVGEPAFNFLLGLKGGEFQLKPFSMPERQTIDGQWESLMMEAARLSDEASSMVAPASQQAVKEEPPCKVEEIVLCSPTGELLYEWQTKMMEKRIQQIAQVEQVSEILSQLLHWQRGDRLELEVPDGRMILMSQLEGRALIRTSSQRPPVASIQPDEEWLQAAKATRGVLACGIIHGRDAIQVETNRENLPTESVRQALLKLPAVIQLMRSGNHPIQRLCWKFATNHIYCAVSPEGALTVALVNYDLVKSAEIERLMGEGADTSRWEPPVIDGAQVEAQQIA
jgi:CheY-like chemotaxis protein